MSLPLRMEMKKAIGENAGSDSFIVTTPSFSGAMNPAMMVGGPVTTLIIWTETVATAGIQPGPLARTVSFLITPSTPMAPMKVPPGNPSLIL
uniref:Uncharacterized protein n=1 Tax=Mastacembelus armatus TaxID=205130 RepID=A0A7N8YQU3_9TELE